MATTLTPNLKLRIDSNLTANAKYNLSRIDLLGATFLVDSTNTVNLRSQVGILIEPNSADIGGSGTGGTVSIGTANHKIAALNVYATDLILDGAFNLKDQAATSTGKLGLVYNSTASGTIKDDTARTLTIDVNGDNRQLILGGSLSLLGGSLILNLSGSSNLNLPISGTLVARDTVDTLTNKTIQANLNNITDLMNSSIALNAAIDYDKLNLLDKIKNADIKSDAAIAYSKLALSNSIKNSDISASPADRIVYPKLDLAGYIVDSDVSPGAAIAYSKLSLAGKIKDADIDPANRITYSNLILANSITNSDISSTAAINYSKLALAGQLVNSDISAAAAIAGSKIVPQFTQSVKTTGMLELDNGTALTKIAPAASGQTADLTFKLPNNYGIANQTLVTDGAGNLVWSDAGSGTVTSVGLAAPAEFTVSGSPVTGAGTLTLTKANQAANQVYAGPTTDGPQPPNFRLLVSDDIPFLPKAKVGLANVDDTSDLDKPISTATQNALDLKYDTSNPANYVDAFGAAAAAPVQSVAGKIGAVTLTSSDVGLGNVDNTSDLNKPISTATQLALNDKYDASNPAGYVNEVGAAAAAPVQSVAGKTGIVTVDKSDVGLGLVPNVDATNPANIVESSSFRFTTDTEKATWNGKQDALGFTPENVANKGVANGYAPLNASGKLDNSYLNATVLNYHGTWNASTNTPPLSDGMVGAAAGDVYIVSVGGTVTFGPGNTITFAEGDWALYSQSSKWEKILNSAAVTSVNGATGSVTVNALNELTGDVTAGPATGSESKVATIAAGAITDSKISNSAAITVSKLAAGTEAQVLTTVLGVSAWAAVPVSSVAGKTGTVLLTKSDVGLPNVDDTSDANKPISLATQAALDLKYDASNPSGFINAPQAAAAAPVQSVNAATGAVTINALNQLTGDVTAGPASGSESKVATIAAGAVTNSKIATNANIAVTKLAAGTDGYVLKTVAGTPTWSDPGSTTVNAISELTGDVTAGPASGSESKVATIANGVITNAKVSATANIAVSKLATGSEGQVLQVVSGVPTWAAASSGQTFPTLVTTWYSSESVNTKTIYHGFSTTDITVEVYDKVTGETVELDSIVRDTNNSVVLTKGGWGGTAVDLKILITALPTATPTITSTDYLNSSSTQAIVTVFFNNEAASYSTEIWDGTQYVAFDSGALTSLQAGGTNPYPVTKGFTQYFTRPTGGSGSVNARVRISYNSAISDWAYFTIDYQPSGEVPQLSFLNTPTQNDTSYTQDVGINWSGGEPTSIIIERFDMGSWQPVTTISTSGSGQKWVQLTRMGSADTQYRIALSNTFGQSNWAETTVFGVTGIPATIGMVNTQSVPGIPENFYFQVSYFPGNLSTNNYEIQRYIGSGSPYQDYDPNNWSAASGGGFFGNPFSTSSMGKPATETAYRIRLIGNTFPTYSNSSVWQIVIVNPAFI